MNKVQEARKKLNLTQSAIAQRLEMPLRTYQEYEKTGEIKSPEILHKFSAEFGVNPNWLLDLSKSFYLPSVQMDIEESLMIDDEFTKVPYYRGVKAGAGMGLILEDHQSHYIAFRHYFVKNTLGASAKDLLALRIGGESMAPLMFDGDDILIDRARLKIMDGPAFLIRIDEEIFVKFLSKLPEHKVKVWSKNPEFGSFEIELKSDSFEVIGQVVWHAHVSEYL